MVELHKELDKTSGFLENIFNLLKLNVEYSFNYVEIHEKEQVLNFYEEKDYLRENFDFFNLTEKYQNINNITSKSEAYIFSLKKMFFQTSRKIYVFKGSSSVELDFFIFQVDQNAYKRHKNTDFDCNFLDFLFEQIFYKVRYDYMREGSNTLISNLGPKEIITLATKKFMNFLSMKDGAKDIDVFEGINHISKLKYENGIATGEIYISKIDPHILSNILQVEGSIRMNEERKVRKLLEGTRGNFSLVADLEYLYGFGGKNFLKTLKDAFRVKIISSEHWELYYKEKKLLKVVEGIPIFDKLLLEKQDFIIKIGNTFVNLIRWEKERLWKLVEEAIESNHGGILVITEGYLEEAKRLAIHSTVFKPFEIKEDLIVDFFNIDGAILMSPKGKCSAIGVILDGLLSGRGDSSRGARYNSALKYYETQKDTYKMMIIVVSEDGVVDILG